MSARPLATTIDTDDACRRSLTRVVGPFLVGDEIARGGMASVHVASLDPSVREREAAPEPGVFAIKLVLPELTNEAEFVEMFLDEARLASRIQHPNVCRVYRYGEVDDTLFLTMDLLRGAPLGAIRRAGAELARRADRDWHRVVARIVADACAGLHAAHELCGSDGQPLHVVHRDVSPQNILVCRDGRSLLLDFGVARSDHRLHHTNVGVVKGKFSYIAPEQILSAPTDRRADVWSVGVVLWELLAGRALFKRAQDHETIGAVLRPVVPPIDGVPAALENVVSSALRADPARRAPTAAVLGDRLEAWLDSVGGCTAEDVAHMVATLVPEEPTLSAPRRLIARVGPPSTPRATRPAADERREARARDATVRVGPTRPVSAPRPTAPGGWSLRLAGPALIALLVALAVWSAGRVLGADAGTTTPEDVRSLPSAPNP